MIVRCTAKLRALLGPEARTLVDVDPADGDVYASLVIIDRRKCLLVTHASTLFSVFCPDVRVAQLRPLGAFVVAQITARLAAEGLDERALGELDGERVRIAKAVDRSVLGCMTDMAITCRLATEHAGGLQALDLNGLNRMLARHISAARDYVPAIDLVRASQPVLTAAGRDRAPQGLSGSGDSVPRQMAAIDQQATIDDALERFLAEQRGRLSERTYQRYEEVIDLLRASLDGYAYSSLTGSQQQRWQHAFDAGDEHAYCRLFGPGKIVEHLGSFLDWFMVRKVICGQELLKASGTVCGKLTRWLTAQGYVAEAIAEDAVAHAREAARDLPVAERLGMLLHDACEQQLDLDPNEIADEDWVEEHLDLEIVDVEPGRVFFERGVGPIEVPRKASDLARPGWSVLITAARLEGRWRLLEVGFVYP